MGSRLFPQDSITQNYDMFMPGLIVRIDQRAAERGLQSHHSEKIGRHFQRKDSLRGLIGH